MEDLLEKITELSARHAFPGFGAGSASQLERVAPQNYRPSDLLPGAKSLFCLGIPVPKGIFMCGTRANEAYWRAANIYYRNIDMILMQIARIVEETGETAVPVFG